MFRFLLYMLAALVLISFLKTVIGVVMKAVAAFVSAGAPAQNRPAPKAPEAQLGGDLHRDPVCGTFVSESTPFQRKMAKGSFYYCSGECKEKHALVMR